MIRTRTALDNNTIMALTKYHHVHKKDVKRKKKITIILGIILFIMSCINAYGIWMKYIGTLSPAIIILRSSVFVILSAIILLNALKGGERNTYRDLKKYFYKTKTEYIDYIITEEAIQMIVSSNSTTHEWNSIDHFEADDSYFYFSSKGRHSIIAKAPMSNDNILALEKLADTKIPV